MESGLTPSERAGREIWFKASAGNDRFHTYVFQQRVGVLIDWYRVLNSGARDQRFATWGLINDPGCCTPGSKNCPAKSSEETFGFDWCPGDEELLKFVGKRGYRDPACDFKDAPVDANDAHGPTDKRQSSCDLAFGTSTGALGLRKFPNPKFDAASWQKLNGKLGSWEGFNRRVSSNEALSDSQVSRLADSSVEPPFLIGMACGACHIAFDPLRPPKDPAHPQWENIRGAIGNQYLRMSEIMVSGMSKNSLEWQTFAHARPGTTDTSAVPNDQVSNAGTINALVNVRQRPMFTDEVVNKWRAVATCKVDKDCWCEKEGKCWLKSTQKEAVHHILKDGSDSIGAREALQRVYINIGSCSEQCWVNHLTDLRQLDPEQRNFGQTPFNIGQCRRDCPNFRAIEDRLGDVFNFLLSREAQATDLYRARGLKNVAELNAQLDKEFGKGKVARGQAVYAENCARCHSSQAAPFQGRDFLQVSADSGLRSDWLGNDQAVAASEIGTSPCRALHSNHMAGHVWQEYASETYRTRPADANLMDRNGGGRGYYRNVSLVNVWAHAPFMHNNSVGPEICGQQDSKNQFYRSPYLDDQGKPLKDAPACMAYDPSVPGRYKLYKASMMDLLNPKSRIPKVTRLDEPIRLDVGPRYWDGERESKLANFMLEIPAGVDAGMLGSLQHKELFRDLVLSKTDSAKLKARLTERVGAKAADEAAAMISEMADEVLRNPKQIISVAGKRLSTLIALYSSCREQVENAGHPFGENLSPEDKQALIAFMATL
ncbi:MAG: cytochrome c [Gammaproteobacteria bacterium]|nr:cytochrome c [Gammaproteobacteria bacterium]